MMAGREWKPGDVAMVLNEHGVWNLAVCSVRAGKGVIWQYGVADSWMPLTADARPLVVLDPDDGEQVERLAERIGHLWQSHDYVRDVVRDALRSLLAPPKPEEPTGLGAVVEDADGEPWVRFASKTGWWWRNFIGVNRRWSDLAAVRVLSEGVTA